MDQIELKNAIKEESQKSNNFQSFYTVEFYKSLKINNEINSNKNHKGLNFIFKKDSVLSENEIENLFNAQFVLSFLRYKKYWVNQDFYNLKNFGPFVFGLTSGFLFSDNFFILLKEDGNNEFISMSNFNKLNFSFENDILKIKKFPNQLLLERAVINQEFEIINNYFQSFYEQGEAFKKIISSYQDKLKESEKEYRKVVQNEVKINTQNRYNELLKKHDKDNDGIIDIISISKTYITLVKHNQDKIISHDRTYLHYFVKLSEYLNVNIIELQNEIKKSRLLKSQKNLWQIEENLEIRIKFLENIWFNANNMLFSLVSSDLVTFYQIYECFEKYGIFENSWEKKVSNKLDNIENKLDKISFAIDILDLNLQRDLKKLTYTTTLNLSKIHDTLNSELKSLKDGLETSNILNSISVYQLYKINKQTKKK